jgi:hypothetical protein
MTGAIQVHSSQIKVFFQAIQIQPSLISKAFA